MDLVTVTDHDSIEAVEPLRRFPDFFLSEEVSIQLPNGTAAHMAVYGITEPQHIELQRRRNDLPSLLAYLQEQDLLFGINHVFSALTGARTLSDFDWFVQHFPLWETQNGAMLESANRYASLIAGELGKGITAGSDAHTMATLGEVCTEVSGACSKSEFLEGLRRGHGVAHGPSGDARRVMREVFGIVTGLIDENPVAALALPLLAALPAVALVNHIKEAVFARYWFQRLRQSRGFCATPEVAV